MKKVTMEDIGKKLGVSVVTVSKALRDQKGVSSQLGEQIRRTADEMGYRRSSRAHNMRVSHTIGIVIAERFLREHQSFYWSLYQKLAERITEKDSTPLLEVIGAGQESENILPRIIEGQRSDGIIVMGTFQRRYMELLRTAPERIMPLIFLDCETESERDDAILSDNIGGGCVMTDYLLSLGHRRIGYVGTLLATSSIDDRYLGYTKALLRHGIEVNYRWIVEDRDRVSGELLRGKELKLPKAGGNELAPTAYFCNCVLTARTLIAALGERGLRVPEDISVVGFDNHLPGGIADAGITTYEINAKAMVTKAVSRILQKIDNPSYAGSVAVVGGSFIERSSAARIGDPVPYI